MLTLLSSTPEEAGIPSSAVIRFLDRLEAYRIPMHSIHIMRWDRLVAEGYYSPCTRDMYHRMFSISKSLTSLAIGKLSEQGRLKLDDPIVTYFPEYVPENPHPWLTGMTIRHMLMMRTCHTKTTYKLDMTRNWVESFFITPPDHKPGTIFHYDTSSSHTLCALTEKLTGMPMLEFLKKEMLREIGFSEDSYMLTDPFGHSLGGSGLVALPEDILRLGYLLMHEGKIGDKQLIGREYLKEALANQTATAVSGPVMSESQGYGYQFWRGEFGAFVCYGMGGQLLICYPDKNLMVMTTADTQGIGGGNQLIYLALQEELLTALSDEQLPGSEDTRKLQERLSGLTLAPVAHIYPSSDMLKDSLLPDVGVSRMVNDREYTIIETDKGFTHMSLSLAGETGVLRYTLKGQKCELPFGLHENIVCRFPVYNMNCASGGVWLDEETLYIKVHLLDSSVGSVHFQLVFGEKDVTAYMKKTEESLFNEYDGHLYGYDSHYITDELRNLEK